MGHSAQIDAVCYVGQRQGEKGGSHRAEVLGRHPEGKEDSCRSWWYR